MLPRRPHSLPHLRLSDPGRRRAEGVGGSYRNLVDLVRPARHPQQFAVQKLLLAHDNLLAGRLDHAVQNEGPAAGIRVRSEENTSELPSLMRISDAVF